MSEVLDRFRLEAKTVVLTGGTGILGRLYARRLAEAGARVLIADVDDAACRQLAAEITAQTGVPAEGVSVDLADEESVGRWASGIIETYGVVDVLINNAATKSPNFFAPLDAFPLTDWNHVMAVNVTGMFLTIRAFGPEMARRGQGNIINVSSIYGIVGPDQRLYEGSFYQEMGGAINTPLIYSVTKGAVIALTRYVATYWGHRGVRANTLTPGGVSSGQNEEFVERYSARVPMGRMATEEEMAGALLYLASDASSYVNGHNLIVDGGWTAW